MPLDDAVDAATAAAFDKAQTELAGQLPGDVEQLAAAQRVEHTGTGFPQPALPLFTKALRHKPLPPLRQRCLYFLTEPYVVNRGRSIAYQFLIELGRAVKLTLGIERQRRQSLHNDRTVFGQFGLIGSDPFKMIWGYGPAAIGSAFNAATRAPHRFQPANMAFGEALAGTWVVG